MEKTILNQFIENPKILNKKNYEIKKLNVDEDTPLKLQPNLLIN